MTQRQSKQLTWITIGFIILLIGIVIGADTGFEGFRAFYNVPGGDKLGHFLLIGTLAFLVNASLGARRVRLGPLQPLLGSLLVTLVVTAEEFSQIFLAHRSFDLMDLTADFVGILILGRLAAHLIRKESE
ncbi:MAG: VanZ family protein [Anaerolineales bacterium]|nr:VanZ family protein [Anaerolineales bacterium]MCB8961321.1 VanZ family protein [Ardenticatenales bacterium]